MLTFHPAARKTSQGFIPMVCLRNPKGQMVGSKVAQTGNAFATADDATAHALIIALRVAMMSPETLRVA